MMEVDVRSPNAGEWIRVDPDPEHRLESVLICDEGETYMVAENMVERMKQIIAPEKMTRQMLFTAQNRDGETFLWPVPTPVAFDHLAYLAMHQWVCFMVSTALH